MAVKRAYVRHGHVGRPRLTPISPNEVANRRAKIEEQRTYLESIKTDKPFTDGTMGMKVENIDINALEKQLARDERALEYLAPKEGTTAEKRKAQIELNEDKEYIAKHGLTRTELGMGPKDDAQWHRVLEKAINEEVGNPEFQRRCERAKRNAALIAPDDTELRNINRYRQE